MEKESRKKINRLIGIGIIGVLVIIGISVFFIIRNIQMNATLDLLVAPVSAQIKINGRVYRNGEHKFDPGEISVEITKDGFRAQNLTINLVANETTKLYTYLVPDDGSLDWYLGHEEDQLILSAIGGEEAKEASEKYVEKNPIIKSLPIVYSYLDEYRRFNELRVDGGAFKNCKREFCLKITDTEGGKYEEALDMIRKKGYNPEDFEIIYEYTGVLE